MQSTPELKLLPFYSNLKRIIEGNYLYIDKTRYAYNLIRAGGFYFLSRPRRFGKSLFVSTLEELLRGNKNLFENLWIGSSDYRWETYGVVSLDFSKIDSHSTVDKFNSNFTRRLVEIGNEYGFNIEEIKGSPSATGQILFKHLMQRYNKIAVLVDEYDNPLVHSLHDTPKATAIREILRSFFAAVKGESYGISFVFITGVSSFNKAGIFSGMNNLRTLSLNENYAGICGYTDKEIDEHLHGHIQAWADKKECSYDIIRNSLRDWYNGYSFGRNTPKIYNPFSVINSLEETEFQNFWITSGTPTFLINFLKKQTRIFDLEEMHSSKEMLATFDIDRIKLAPLLFQAGYLTIIDYDEGGLCKLGYPNFEVKVSFQKYLLEAFAHLPQDINGDALSVKLYKALKTNDLEQAVSTLTILFAHVPYLLHDPQEKYYHALLQMAVTGTGIEAYSDVMTAHGRIDMVIYTKEYLYIVEVKYNSSPQEALQQIHDQRYYERFLEQPKPIVLVGLSFNKSPGEFNITYASEMLSVQITSKN